VREARYQTRLVHGAWWSMGSRKCKNQGVCGANRKPEWLVHALVPDGREAHFKQGAALKGGTLGASGRRTSS
jgi:hypothetical protein